MNINGFVSPAEAADYLKLNQHTIRRWAKQGLIPFTRDNGRLWIPVSVLESPPKRGSGFRRPGFKNTFKIVGELVHMDLRDKDGNVKAVTTFDATDLDLVKLGGGTWSASKVGRNEYVAVTRHKIVKGKLSVLILSRVIMGANGDEFIDHINMSPLDNRRCNLRFVTKSKNMQNRLANKTSPTGIKNVHFDKATNRYRVRIVVNGREISIGRFNDIQAASDAATAARIKYHTHCPELSGESV